MVTIPRFSFAFIAMIKLADLFLFNKYSKKVIQATKEVTEKRNEQPKEQIKEPKKAMEKYDCNDPILALKIEEYNFVDSLSEEEVLRNYGANKKDKLYAIMDYINDRTTRNFLKTGHHGITEINA